MPRGDYKTVKPGEPWWSNRSPHRDFDNAKKRHKDRIEEFCRGKGPAARMTATFTALVEGELELELDTSKVFEEEAARREVQYLLPERSPVDFFIRECGLSSSHPLIPMLMPLVATERRISRLDGTFSRTPLLAALTAMWFYKCHECAQVYVRIPKTKLAIKKAFWKQFRDISLTATEIFAEEQAAPFGKINYHHFQRRTGVFVTDLLPRIYSPNVMFIFAGDADWNHDTARKLYIY